MTFIFCLSLDFQFSVSVPADTDLDPTGPIGPPETELTTHGLNPIRSAAEAVEEIVAAKVSQGDQV